MGGLGGEGSLGGKGGGEGLVGDVGGLLRGADVCFRFGEGCLGEEGDEDRVNSNNNIYNNNNTNNNTVKNTNTNTTTNNNGRRPPSPLPREGGGEGRPSIEGRSSGETWEGISGGGWGNWGDDEGEREINPFTTFRELRPKNYPPAEKLVPITCLNSNVSQFPDRLAPPFPHFLPFFSPFPFIKG